jgi:hypothetical protein
MNLPSANARTRKIILVSMLAAPPAFGATPCEVWGSLEPCAKQQPWYAPITHPAPAVKPAPTVQQAPAVVAQAPAQPTQGPMMEVYGLTGVDRNMVDPRIMSPGAAQAIPFCSQWSTQPPSPRNVCKVAQTVHTQDPFAKAFTDWLNKPSADGTKPPDVVNDTAGWATWMTNQGRLNDIAKALPGLGHQHPPTLYQQEIQRQDDEDYYRRQGGD